MLLLVKIATFPPSSNRPAKLQAIRLQCGRTALISKRVYVAATIHTLEMLG
jgi:hypothetical protein